MLIFRCILMQKWKHGLGTSSSLWGVKARDTNGRCVNIYMALKSPRVDKSTTEVRVSEEDQGLSLEALCIYKVREKVGNQLL